MFLLDTNLYTTYYGRTAITTVMMETLYISIVDIVVDNVLLLKRLHVLPANTWPNVCFMLATVFDVGRT